MEQKEKQTNDNYPVHNLSTEVSGSTKAHLPLNFACAPNDVLLKRPKEKHNVKLGRVDITLASNIAQEYESEQRLADLAKDSNFFEIVAIGKGVKERDDYRVGDMVLIPAAAAPYLVIFAVDKVHLMKISEFELLGRRLRGGEIPSLVTIDDMYDPNDEKVHNAEIAQTYSKRR